MKKLFLVAVLLVVVTPSYAAENSIWDKVMAKQNLRCGYVTYDFGFMKDVNTGKFTGYDKDIMEKVTDKLGLKLEWIPAGGWGTVVEDLKSGKFDMLCNSYWTSAEIAKYVLYTRPTMYQPAFFIARTDDRRFDDKKPLINDPSISIAAVENDGPYFYARDKYPKATIHPLPHSFDYSLIATEVATKKSDLTIVDAVTAGKYNEKNPGKVRLIMVDDPIQIVPTAFVIPTGETQMKQAIDQVMDEMILSGDLKLIFARYNKYPHSYYFPAIPYQEK